ncbi:MAG: BREX-1 system phosphatase PglZ type A, partial [Thermodesulfobacteriota bacterium]|nr:BREX-1 system phosphatase PglZ type A [Thermodesulfobacteriota bacterium]
MQDIERTTRSILKKFEAPDDYEKRKIVFWYDKDETADDWELETIKSALAKDGIKLHRLNNNFFATKKLLEKDDTESNYLIYSRGPEREYESNWLLDIQLYSSRFENSKVSDIKSELGIEGYDLDKFLEANSRFFKSKKRVSAFKQFYQKDWRKEEFVLGILAVLSGSSTIDLKEILRKLLIPSLEEEDNPIWGKIKKYGLVDYFWNTVKRDFKYSFDNPTLKKLFLSFIITHIDRNTKVALKTYNQYVNRQSNECEIFIRGWLDHSKDSASFDNHCQQLLSENGNKLERDLTS